MLTSEQQAQMELNLSKLPDFCFSVMNTTDEVILIKRGEEGYFPYYEGAVKGKDKADELNDKIGVTPAQAEAMLAGSMFGWHVKGADVDVAQEIVSRQSK